MMGLLVIVVKILLPVQQLEVNLYLGEGGSLSQVLIGGGIFQWQLRLLQEEM
mgnify:CR=1 FL=1